MACTADDAVPVVYDEDTFVNVAYDDEDNTFTKSGGVDGSFDAYAKALEYVEGFGCGWWQWTISEAAESDSVLILIEDEFGTTDRYGWFFSNQIVNFRRAYFHGNTSDTLVSYVVGNSFAIHYDAGAVTFWENALDVGQIDLIQTGAGYTLPTDRRWRLRVYIGDAAGKIAPIIQALEPPPGAPGMRDYCGSVESL